MLDFLPPRLYDAVRHVNLMRLYELRVRADKPLRANLGGSFCYLGERGEVQNAHAALFPTKQEISDAVFAASGYSVYSVAEQIRKGFITGAEGERIGIAGSYVYEGGQVLSVHDITSLCIRVPHDAAGCAQAVYDTCLADQMRSVILLSSPGAGKTTLLRDLTRIVCEKRLLNILVCDERGELSAGDVGASSDVIRFCDKLTAFTAGIRALRPDLVVTDELLPEDYRAVERAISAGIHVFASAHLVRFEDVPEKIFDRYLFLSGVGQIGKVCDACGNALA